MEPIYDHPVKPEIFTEVPNAQLQGAAQKAEFGQVWVSLPGLQEQFRDACWRGTQEAVKTTGHTCISTMETTLKKHIAVFGGHSHDAHGMPIPFYYYFVGVSPSHLGSGRFTCVAAGISAGAPVETQGTKVIAAQSEDEALEVILRFLKDHPAHKGLFAQDAPLPELQL